VWKEHGTYIVVKNRFDLPYEAKAEDKRSMDSFDSLKEARKRFFELCTKLNFKKYK
jgi:hypothetical protein